MLIGLVGSVGIMFVGIFSLERAGGFLHGVSSVLAFSGYIISISGFSLKIYQYTTWIPKFFIVNGLMPLLSVILYFMFL